jgi:hypothetical protein
VIPLGFLARRLERFDAAPPPPLVEVEPLDMVFTRQAVVSSFDVEPETLRFLAEFFVSNSGQFAVNSFGANTQGGFAVTGGTGVITNSSATLMHTDVRTGPDVAMPQVFVSVDVTARGSTGSFVYDTPRVGISAGATNWFGAYYDATGQRLYLEQCVGGTLTNYIKGGVIALTAPFRLGFSLTGKCGCVWTDTGSGWVFRGSQDFGANPQTVSLAGFKAFFGAAKSGSGSASWTFDNLRAGRFGAVGVRDPSIITDESGRPIDFGGKIRFLATTATPAGNAARDYQGVWEIDPATWALTQVGVICVARGSGIYVDTAGHLVKNDDGTWRLAICTWGNGPADGGDLRVRHVVTSANLSEGAHVVSGTAELNLARGSSAGGTYDPHMMRFGGVWNIAHTIVDPQTFVGQNYYVALSTTTDFSTFTAVGADTTRPSTEGTRLLRTNADLWVAAADNNPVAQYVYDETLSFVGSGLNCTPALPTPNPNAPWPMIAPFGDQQVMLTFDGTLFNGVSTTMGNLWVYTAPRYEP